ncbi:MAG TPA: cyclopropane fatty acyl phospholipid synthase [Kofleriaceae bacterium]|nr:cyclopropane fatty acyl phospholipid synthase [Kofleriaceae bacterium]
MSAALKLLASLDDRKAADLVHDLLASAGVSINGPEPWDLQVNDDRFYTRVLRDGTLGFGEAYVDGWWDARALDQLLTRLVRARIDAQIRDSWVLLAHVVRARFLNLQAVTRAFEIAHKHYDLGNDLYERMLDARMMYTCAYWRDGTTKTLEEAQEAKLDLICRKLGLEPGMRVLELGCGWGGFASFAAERYGAHVTGYTVSKEQVAWASERYAHLKERIDFRLDDYRHARGHYDAVVSIGLMEHVGPKNHRGYMELAHRCLAPGGVAFVHTIGGNRPRAQIDPFFHKYVFPNAVLPSLSQLTTAADDLFVIEDVHNIGPHYDHTLCAWQERFDAAWPELRARYGEPFRRMWTYYLMTSAAGFRARYLQLFQIVMTREGTPQKACRVS